jgi:hypothetical protein
MDDGARTGQRRRIPAGLAAVIAAALLGSSGLNAPGAGADPAQPPSQPPSPAIVDVAPASDTALTAVTMPDAVPHLPSPDNLPPGTTREPPERRTLGYLRDIWNTVRTEDVTMSDMLLLIAQRPMNAPPPERESQPAPVVDLTGPQVP